MWCVFVCIIVVGWVCCRSIVILLNCWGVRVLVWMFLVGCFVWCCMWWWVLCWLLLLCCWWWLLVFCCCNWVIWLFYCIFLLLCVFFLLFLVWILVVCLLLLVWVVKWCLVCWLNWCCCLVCGLLYRLLVLLILVILLILFIIGCWVRVFCWYWCFVFVCSLFLLKWVNCCLIWWKLSRSCRKVCFLNIVVVVLVLWNGVLVWNSWWCCRCLLGCLFCGDKWKFLLLVDCCWCWWLLL